MEWFLWFAICLGAGWNPYQAYENPQTGMVEFHQRADMGTKVAIVTHRQDGR